MFDGGIGERFDEHRHKRGTAAADRPGKSQQGSIDLHHQPDVRKQPLRLFPLGIGERVEAFADNDSLADGDRRVGNRTEMVRSGRKYGFVLSERHAGSHRNDDFPGQQLLHRRQNRFDLMGFHGYDHHVGELRDTGGIVESQKAFRLRIAPQFGPVAGAGADLAGLQRPRRGKPFGKSLRHISESDKSYLHNTIHFSNLGFIPAVRRL